MIKMVQFWIFRALTFLTQICRWKHHKNRHPEMFQNLVFCRFCAENRSRCGLSRFFMVEMDSTGPIRPPKVYYELFNRPKHWVPIVERRKNGQLDNGQLGIWGRPVTRLLLYFANLISLFPAMYSVFSYLDSFLVFKPSQNMSETFDRTV